MELSNNQILKITRGDSFVLPIFINLRNRLDPERYILLDGDKLYFSVMEAGKSFEESLIKKILTSENLNKHGDPVLEFTPNDTEFVVPGRYYMQIKLLLADGTVLTILPKKQFIIGD